MIIKANETSPKVSSIRLASLDALRGFDMLWIVGLDQMVKAAAKCFPWPWLIWLSGQMEHPQWEGYTLYDQIFPLFLFIVGVAIPYSIGSQRNRGISEPKMYGKIFFRLLMLVLLGIIYNGGLRLSGIDQTRFCSVLGFIGIGYFFAAIIVMNFAILGQVIWCLAIMSGYCLAIYLIPVPGGIAGDLTPQGSIASYIDQRFMPGKLYHGYFDPEGIFPCISGISTALLGAITGYWLRRDSAGHWAKAAGLFIAGLLCLGLGLLAGNYYPIIKNLWTGSFVLLTGGVSILLLALFYVIIDCLTIKKWALIFIVVGVNPITIYMACRLIDFGHTADFLFGGLIGKFSEQYHWLGHSTAILLIEWLALYFLYRKKIIFKV
ncbi:MAG: DUF5009 domain-containing protein [Sedimentisphaerales bacterium]|nr:DUF5009 domain-containing protein [Sedimentisphaerales bacterium]MBN2841487.1 DUF5009 domain-containing protein [Sedimentisphaerales bacterium]